MLIRVDQSELHCSYVQETIRHKGLTGLLNEATLAQYRARLGTRSTATGAGAPEPMKMSQTM